MCVCVCVCVCVSGEVSPQYLRDRHQDSEDIDDAGEQGRGEGGEGGSSGDGEGGGSRSGGGRESVASYGDLTRTLLLESVLNARVSSKESNVSGLRRGGKEVVSSQGGSFDLIVDVQVCVCVSVCLCVVCVWCV